MKKFLVVSFISTILLQTSLAQATFKISSYNTTPEAFQYLLLGNKQIAANDTINEKIVDLVNPMLLDSVIERKKQHHRLFLVGWLIHAFGGYNWRAIDMHKQKIVGTVTHHGRSGKIEYSEYDINFDLGFHLRKYINRICVACDLQKKFHRQNFGSHQKKDYTLEPFVRDTNNLNSKLYSVDAELTPPYAFIPQLNYLFYPTLPDGGTLKDHPNFGTAAPTMGFYGVNCLDCNHTCHPEIHPYEWVWWLKANEEDEGSDKTWLVGLFHESSKRFKNWSQNPMTGQISIPFAYEVDDQAETDDANPLYKIKVEHLVFNKFVDAGFKSLAVPDSAFAAVPAGPFQIQDNRQGTYYFAIEFNTPIKSNNLKYWFSDLNLDKQNHILSGYFNFATSVQDLYTTRITFGSEHHSETK
ncbi:MAG TPA: hypothetical protein VK174_04540 [Chitinophagales bacterium]|nr:hypothetical protein [Chitinophagales bacterium]